MGRYLVGLGVLLVLAGLVVMLGERLGFRPGNLPGDIRIECKRGSFYFPVVTCLIISAVLSVISWFFRSR
jgi:hypothetical protein